MIRPRTGSRRDPAARDPRGFALLIVLWTLVLVSFLVARLSVAARGEARIAFNLRAEAVEQARADGAVQEAAFRLLDMGARHWAADGVAHGLTVAGGTVQVRMVDEATKVNLNSASAGLLAALMQAAGAGPALAASIAAAVVDWRTDGSGSGTGDGATAQEIAQSNAAYLAAGLDYAPPHAPFRSVDELGRVLGMTPGLLAQLRPHLTVFSSYGPSSATRDPLVLRAVQIVRAAGGQLPDDTEFQPVDVISVKAVATGADGAKATRQAVIRLDLKAQGSEMRVLAWN